MRLILTIFILVNLCVFSSALDRRVFTNSRRPENVNQKVEATPTVQAAPAKSAPQTKQAVPSFKQETKQQTTTHQQEASKILVDNTQKATQKTTTTTTTQQTTQASKAAAASAKTDTTAKSQTSTQQKTTTTKTQAQAQTQAQAKKQKIMSNVNGKLIEHVTQEPAPAGLVRPVLVPPPDALPNTFKFKPVIEGKNGEMVPPPMHGNVFSPPQFTEKGQKKVSDEDDDEDEDGQSEDGDAADEQTTQVLNDDSVIQSQEQSQSQSQAQTQDQAQDQGQGQGANWWHHQHHEGEVTADAVDSLADADREDPNFPPKYPPCSGCEQQQTPPQCCMTVPAVPYSRGYWHHHGHHQHSSDESPQQIVAENEGMMTSSDDSSDSSSDSSSDGQMISADQSSTAPGAIPTPGVNEPSASSSTAAMMDIQVTVPLVSQMISDALVKNHDSILADFTSRLDQMKTELEAEIKPLTDHLDEVKAMLEAEIKTLSDSLAAMVQRGGVQGPPGPKGDKGEKGDTQIVIQSGGDNDYDNDDDNNDDDSNDDSSDASTSTGADTVNILKSLEKKSEDLTNKLDEADTLDAATSTGN